jgi:hypothetical protein
MKRKVFFLALLFSLLVVFTASAYAAPALNGFIGIPWGANGEQVRQGMAQNGFSFHNDNKWGILTQQTFENGSYAGYMSYLGSAFLKYDTMYKGGVSIKATDGGGLDFLYSRLKNLLQDKYGALESETQEWANNNPNTGVKFTSTTWLIPNGEKKPHRIVLSKQPAFHLYGLQFDAAVSVTYINEALEAELDKRQTQNI